MVFALVADRAWIRFDVDLNQILAAFLDEIHGHHDAQHISNLVGQVFQ